MPPSMLLPLPPPPPPPPPMPMWRAPKAMPSKSANRWQPSLHAVVPKKARPSLKAVAAETDATNMADSTAVADATKVVDEGTSKKIPEKRNCTNRQKALAADIDLTHMAESTPVADATQVADQGTTRRRRRKSKSRNSQGGDTVEARSKTKSKQMLVSSSASSVNPPGVARDSEALNVAPASGHF